MLLAISVYFISYFLTRKICAYLKQKFHHFPHIKFVNGGVVFTSSKTHRIKIFNSKVIQLCDRLYVKSENSLVVFENIKQYRVEGGYLYFKSNGETQILFDSKSYSKYFFIKIKSSQFDLSELKQKAIIDILNNNFNINFSKIAKKYVKILKNILKIEINQENIKINANKYNLSFKVMYKLNNKIMCVNIR